MSKSLVGAVLLVIALAGCGSAAPEGPADTDRVDLPKSYRFDPVSIKVSAGPTVTWTNNDQFTHTVRLLEDEEVIGEMKPGETLEHSFDEPGEYRYDCSLHPKDMKGTVTVR